MENTENMNLEFPVKKESLKCKRCGRRLKNPESIELGFGTICYQKYQNRKKLIPLFVIPKKEIDEVDKKTAEMLTKKVSKLETKVKNLKESNKVKETVIEGLVKKLIPDNEPDASARRTSLIREFMKEAEEKH